MANPIHRFNIIDKDKRSQRKVADSTTELDKTHAVHGRVSYGDCAPCVVLIPRHGGHPGAQRQHPHAHRPAGHAHPAPPVPARLRPPHLALPRRQRRVVPRLGRGQSRARAPKHPSPSPPSRAEGSLLLGRSAHSSQVRSMGDSIAAAEPEAQFRRTFRTPYFGEEAEQRTATDEELRDR